MTTETSQRAMPGSAEGAPPFPRILCGVNGTRAARAAAHAAIALAAGGGELRLVAIAHRSGVGASRQALLSPERADAALAAASALAREAGVPCTGERIDDPEPAHRLLREAEGADLLAIGSPIRSRAQGMLVGEAAASALHRSPVPVLLAHPGVEEAPFPARVVAATDAAPATRPVVELAARLARRHGTPLTLVHVADRRTPAEHRELARQATVAQELTGSDPLTLCERGPVVPVIADVADAHAGTLLVLGSAGRRGLAALGSVSERAGARTRGAALVLRPPRAGSPS